MNFLIHSCMCILMMLFSCTPSVFELHFWWFSLLEVLQKLQMFLFSCWNVNVLLDVLRLLLFLSATWLSASWEVSFHFIAFEVLIRSSVSFPMPVLLGIFLWPILLMKLFFVFASPIASSWIDKSISSVCNVNNLLCYMVRSFIDNISATYW